MLLAATASQAANITQSFHSVAAEHAGFADTIARFNPSLGHLDSILITFTANGSLSGVLSAPEADRVYLNVAGYGGAMFIGSSILASPSIAIGDSRSYGGPFADFVTVQAHGSGSSELTGTQTDGFVGAGFLDVMAFGSLMGWAAASDGPAFFEQYGPGNFDVRGSIRYVYTRDSGPSDAPEPSTWVTLVLGFGLVGSFVRRARGAAFTLAPTPSRRQVFAT